VLRCLFVPTLSGTDTLSIVLEPSALRDVVLHGRVTDATTGAPVEVFSITVLGLPAENVEYNSPRHEFRSHEGRFTIGALAPMDLSLFVSARGYRDAGAVPEPRAPGRHRIDVALFPFRALEVRVMDQHANPVPCTISVYDSHGAPMWLPVSDGGMAASLSVGPDGQAILQNLPAAPVRVTVRLSGEDTWPEDERRSWEFPFDLTLPIEGMQELEIDVPN